MRFTVEHQNLNPSIAASGRRFYGDERDYTHDARGYWVGTRQSFIDHTRRQSRIRKAEYVLARSRLTFA